MSRFVQFYSDYSLLTIFQDLLTISHFIPLKLEKPLELSPPTLFALDPQV